MKIKNLREFLDALDEIDRLTRRLTRLHEAQKIVGNENVYAATDRYGVEREMIVGGLQRLLRQVEPARNALANELHRAEHPTAPIGSTHLEKRP